MAMAYHIFIVSSMLFVGLATSTPAPAPSTSVTLETCGITKACGPNDTYTILCPASRTCNEYYKCDKGVVSIQICDKAFYLFWLAPVYDPAQNRCKMVYSLCSPVRPNENGVCPAAAPELTTFISKDMNAPVKRHAEPAVQADAAKVEPTKESFKEESKPEETTAEKKPEYELKTGVVEQAENKAVIKDGEPQIKKGKPVASSASVATAPLSVIVIAILISVFVRH